MHTACIPVKSSAHTVRLSGDDSPCRARPNHLPSSMLPQTHQMNGKLFHCTPEVSRLPVWRGSGAWLLREKNCCLEGDLCYSKEVIVCSSSCLSLQWLTCWLVWLLRYIQYKCVCLLWACSPQEDRMSPPLPLGTPGQHSPAGDEVGKEKSTESPRCADQSEERDTFTATKTKLRQGSR